MSRTKPQTHGATGAVTYTAGAMPVTLDQSCRGFHVNGDGDLACTFIDGTTATITVKDGGYYPYQLDALTSFTGTNIVVLL